MNGVIDYYERPPRDYRENLAPGLLCTAAIPWALEIHPNRIRVDFLDPKNPANANYVFETTDLSGYDPANDKPLRHLALDSENFILAIPYKFRPCILLSEPRPEELYPIPGNQGFLVVPLFSILNANDEYHSQINRETVLRAQAYQLSNIFYLPASDEFDVQESFARLDKIEFVRVEHLFPKPTQLTPTANDLLRQWAWFYQGCPILDPALEVYMDKAKEELDKRLGGA
jgi:hypothetical protein